LAQPVTAPVKKGKIVSVLWLADDRQITSSSMRPKLWTSRGEGESDHRRPVPAVESTNGASDQLCVNTIRTIAMDAVQAANSGHPGTPMALAPVVYYLWQRILRFDSNHPIWPNRDRFVLSVGHASMLLYARWSEHGVFLQITCDDAIELPVPGRKYTFGVVKAAQARADFDVLVQRDRRALRAHLGAGVAAGLRTSGWPPDSAGILTTSDAGAGHLRQSGRAQTGLH
jgi:Transketolase, thiamine diphosphate binding domain